MSNKDLKSQLQLRRVGLEELEQFDQLLRYVFQVTREDLVRGGYEEGELERAKRPLLERADVFGWFKGGDLVSQICIYPCRANIHGAIYSMGGVTGVGTYPEFAGHGLMGELIHQALLSMRQRGQSISYLYPYSIPFYRRQGWEIMSDRMSFTVGDWQLPSPRELPGHIARRPVTHADVIKVYDAFALRTHGALIRDQADWEEYWRWEDEAERTAAVYYTEDDAPQGCLIYWIEENVMHVKEMFYLNQQARRGLWNFISAHESMLDEVKGHSYKNEPLAFYLEDSRIEESIEPYFMARIVDVRAFLEKFPFTGLAEPFHFVVADKVAPWNNGVFSVAAGEPGRNLIGTAALGKAVHLDVGTLVSLLLNYRRPSFFAELEHLIAADSTVRLLEQIIPQQQPYCSDYF